jgi:hypothetical protein
MVHLTATIRAHKIFREEKQTVISRPLRLRGCDETPSLFSEAGNA